MIKAAPYSTILLSLCLCCCGGSSTTEDALTASVSDSSLQGITQNAKTYSAVCRYVVDGDSLYLRGLKKQIRLWGVDAPERDEVGYQQAKNALRDSAQGQSLQCVKKEFDKYGRIVARCFTRTEKEGHWREINRAMIHGGTTKEYCRFSRGFYGHCKSQ